MLTKQFKRSLNDQIIAPGATIGILGDGQLGRMIVLAGSHMGYKFSVLGPGGPNSPAGEITRRAYAWAKDGTVSDEILKKFLDGVSVVTLEWENVPVTLLDRIADEGIPVRPCGNVLQTSQSRLAEKAYAQSLRIPVTQYWSLRSTGEVLHAVQNATFPSILKTDRDGYDGKGQWRITHARDLEDVWSERKVPCILEQVVDFTRELSVIVARQPGREAMPVFGPFENVHENGILVTTMYPAEVPRVLQEEAIEAARKLAHALGVHGLLAVEFFVTEDNHVLFNEMAPRPHNSGHPTIECCYTSQFTQLVNAICNRAWGSTECHSGAIMRNLLGTDVVGWVNDMWAGKTVHIYGKTEIKPGRKMGHVVEVISTDDGVNARNH